MDANMKALEDIIEKKRQQIERNNYAKSIILGQFFDREKLAMLEPIFNVLKQLQDRIDLLEGKNKQ
jgi:hypothetical protein